MLTIMLQAEAILKNRPVQRMVKALIPKMNNVIAGGLTYQFPCQHQKAMAVSGKDISRHAGADCLIGCIPSSKRDTRKQQA